MGGGKLGAVGLVRLMSKSMRLRIRRPFSIFTSAGYRLA
jgi:hypothetical protein